MRSTVNLDRAPPAFLFTIDLCYFRVEINKNGPFFSETGVQIRILACNIGFSNPFKWE